MIRKVAAHVSIRSAGLLFSATNRNGATTAHATATTTNSLFQPLTPAISLLQPHGSRAVCQRTEGL